MTSRQFFSLFFTLNKAKTWRENFKVVCAIMRFNLIKLMYQFSATPPYTLLMTSSYPIFLHLYDRAEQKTLIPCRILYGTEKRLKEMVQLSRNVFETFLNFLSPFFIDGMSLNRQQNVSASLNLGVALYFLELWHALCWSCDWRHSYSIFPEFWRVATGL